MSQENSFTPPEAIENPLQQTVGRVVRAAVNSSTASKLGEPIQDFITVDIANVLTNIGMTCDGRWNSIGIIRDDRRKTNGFVVKVMKIGDTKNPLFVLDELLGRPYLAGIRQPQGLLQTVLDRSLSMLQTRVESYEDLLKIRNGYLHGTNGLFKPSSGRSTKRGLPGS